MITTYSVEQLPYGHGFVVKNDHGIVIAGPYEHAYGAQAWIERALWTQRAARLAARLAASPPVNDTTTRRGTR